MADYHRWLVSYHVLDDDGTERDLYQEEGPPPPIAIGEGIIAQGGRRYRVVDVWYSDDKHGFYDVGKHVFMRDVTDTADDLPGTLAPDYFGGSPAPQA